MSSTRSRKTFEFGPDDRLIGAITEPPQGRATLGAVIAEMGMAEMRVARRLASLGIVTLQIREREKPVDWEAEKAGLNAMWAQNFRAALELLREQRGIERFIFMGNCGRGSVAFRIALEDPRVIGLILSNPHISPALTIRESYAKRLLTPASWKQLLTGKANLGYHLPNVRLLVMSLLKRAARISEQALIDQSGDNQDATMPDRFDQRVGHLLRRGVKVLMAFSENDAGLTYFRRLYGQSFQRLKAMPGLSIKLLSTETHIPSHDAVAAGALVSMVDRWAHDSGFATPPIIRDNERRDNQPHAMSPSVRPLEPVGG